MKNIEDMMRRVANGEGWRGNHPSVSAAMEWRVRQVDRPARNLKAAKDNYEMGATLDLVDIKTIGLYGDSQHDVLIIVETLRRHWLEYDIKRACLSALIHLDARFSDTVSHSLDNLIQDAINFNKTDRGLLLETCIATGYRMDKVYMQTFLEEDSNRKAENITYLLAFGAVDEKVHEYLMSQVFDMEYGRQILSAMSVANVELPVRIWGYHLSGALGLLGSDKLDVTKCIEKLDKGSGYLKKHISDYLASFEAQNMNNACSRLFEACVKFGYLDIIDQYAPMYPRMPYNVQTQLISTLAYRWR